MCRLALLQCSFRASFYILFIINELDAIAPPDSPVISCLMPYNNPLCGEKFSLLQLFSAKFWDNQQQMTKEEEKKIKRLLVVVIFLGILIFVMLGFVIYGMMQQLATL